MTAAPARWVAVIAVAGGLLAGIPGTAAPAPDRLTAAVDAYGRGDLNGARGLLESLAPEAGPLGGRAAYLLGVVALTQKRFTQAETAFEQAARALPVLADYARYYQAVAAFNEGQFDRAAQMFQGMLRQFPQSTVRGLALFWKAESLWGAHAREAPDAFHAYLEQFGDGRHAPQAWYDMGQSLEQQGKWGDAAQAYRRIGVAFAATPYAAQAAARLAVLAQTHPLPPDATPVEAFYKRALDLAAAGDFWGARVGLERVLTMPRASAVADGALYTLGVYAFEGRRYADANRLFRQDLNLRQAHADDSLLYLVRIALAVGREADALALARTLAHDYPRSSLAPRGLYLIGMAREDRGALGPAQAQLREAGEAYPQTRWGSRALWEVGWLGYRAGQLSAARGTWLRLVERAPASDAAPAALYWAGRAADALGRADLARDAYRRAQAGYPDTYYGQQAAARLGAPVRVPVDPLQPASALGSGPSVERFRELDALAQTEDATRELETVARTAPDRNRAGAMILLSQRYTQQDQVMRGITTAEDARDLLAVPPGRGLPLALWEGLYPLPRWSEISQAAARAGVDPYLIAGLVREESRWDARIVSSAGAVGLMQLMPGTAQSTARSLGLPAPDARGLVDPATNITLGTAVLRSELARFGRTDLALAAYNAGPGAVARWGPGRAASDPDKFIEDIPYPETRGYVKTVLQSAGMYRWLYKDGHPTPGP